MEQTPNIRKIDIYCLTMMNPGIKFEESLIRMSGWSGGEGYNSQW